MPSVDAIILELVALVTAWEQRARDERAWAIILASEVAQ